MIALLTLLLTQYQLQLEIDLPVIALGTALTMTVLAGEAEAPACLPDCDRTNLLAIDRSVLGNYDEGAHTAADILVAAMLAAPLVVSAIDQRGEGLLTEAVLFLQALALAQGAAQLTKAAVRRPAPLVYDPSVPLDAKDSYDAGHAFFSGHTTTAFTAASFLATSFALKNPESPYRWLVLAAAAVAATTVPALKMAAGYHFPTDVVAGALVGTAIGVLVPVLHLAD